MSDYFPRGAFTSSRANVFNAVSFLSSGDVYPSRRHSRQGQRADNTCDTRDLEDLHFFANNIAFHIL